MATENGANGQSTVNFERDFGNIINGVSVSTTVVRHGVNPATGKALYDVPLSGQAEVDEAVRCGRLAFAEWKKVPLKDRQEAVRKFADALEKETDGFARLLTLEVGKPVRANPSQIRSCPLHHTDSKRQVTMSFYSLSKLKLKSKMG